jgi:hypothetical protein
VCLFLSSMYLDPAAVLSGAAAAQAHFHQF